MHIDEQMLDDVWNVIQNRTMRSILKFIGKDGAYRYSELLKFVNSQSSVYKSNSKTAYFLKKMLDATVVKLDSPTRTYILTRIGVQSLLLIKEFESICSKFDLNDCNADGKVKIKTIISIERGNQ